MTDTWIIVGLCVLVLVSIAYELWRRLFSSRPWELTPEQYAYKHGYYQAAQGFGREDYPLDYTEAERDAWRRGWDEYQESKQ